jgi:hypothetical protein
MEFKVLDIYENTLANNKKFTFSVKCKKNNISKIFSETLQFEECEDDNTDMMKCIDRLKNKSNYIDWSNNVCSLPSVIGLTVQLDNSGNIIN